MQVLSHGDPALELRRVQALVGRNVDGLILIPTHDPARDARPARRARHAHGDRGSADDRRPPLRLRDDRRPPRDARDHRAVIALGHRSLLFVVRDPRLPTTQRRIEGFAEAAARRARIGRRAPARPVRGGVRAPGRRRARRAEAGRPRSSRATARSRCRSCAFCMDLGVALARRRLAGRVRRAVWAPILSPPLAVVRHPTQRIAQETWQRMLLRLREPDARPKRITLNAQLVPAGSLARPGRRTMTLPLARRGRRDPAVEHARGARALAVAPAAVPAHRMRARARRVAGRVALARVARAAGHAAPRHRGPLRLPLPAVPRAAARAAGGSESRQLPVAAPDRRAHARAAAGLAPGSAPRRGRAARPRRRRARDRRRAGSADRALGARASRWRRDPR